MEAFDYVGGNLSMPPAQATYVSNLNRIFYLQKRVVRAIANSDYRAHSSPLFAKLGILDIFQVNSFQIAKFMFIIKINYYLQCF